MVILRKATLALAAAAFLAGTAATAGHAGTDQLREAAGVRNIPLYRFDDQAWITLPDFALLSGAVLDADQASRRLVLTLDGRRAVFHAGSRRVLVEDTITTMDAPVRFVNGVEAIPLAFAARLRDPAYQPEPEPERAPGPGAGTDEPNLFDLLSRALHPDLGQVISEGVRRATTVIVIDPGHGGKDAGAIGPYGLTEKAVALDISWRLRDYLAREHPEVRIIMTREDDYCVSLEQRVRLANESEADLFISVHANSARLNRYVASGFETFYPRQRTVASAGSAGNPYSPQRAIHQSRYLAALVQEELAGIFIEEIPDRGVKPAGFYVLRHTGMPAVLVEVGFISNPNVELNLRQPGVRQRIAEAIGHAVDGYLAGRPLRESVASDTPLIREMPVGESERPGH